MAKRKSDEDAVLGTLGAAAIGGPGLAGAYAAGGLFAEGRSSLGDLGPRPIGSDPWLLDEVRRAIAREDGVDASRVTVEVKDAVVTLGGEVDEDEQGRIESAARSVQGIKKLHVAFS
jgi:osmotically-inducible protein OsmY